MLEVFGGRYSAERDTLEVELFSVVDIRRREIP